MEIAFEGQMKRWIIEEWNVELSKNEKIHKSTLEVNLKSNYHYLTDSSKSHEQIP